MTAFSLALDDDQQQLQRWVHQFAADVVRPAAHEWDEREEFPWPIVQEAAKIGLYSMDFGIQMAADPTGLSAPVAIEELWWGDAGIGMAIFGSGLAATGIAQVGTPAQVAEWLPQCYGSGPDDVMLGAYCVSEPDAGSDVSALRTRAAYDEAADEWVLNGTKAWATNGGIADTHVVTATVDPSLGVRGHASFVVPKGTRGLSQGQKYKKHGIRASHTAEVVLDDCRVSGRMLLGGKERLDARLARAREGKSTGAEPALATFEATRPFIAAQAIGIARAAYEESLRYALDRRAFGRPIIQNQAIAFMLADMLCEIDAARLLVWRAAWLAHNGGFTSAEGSQAKLKAGRVAVWVTERAIQIHGAYGYTRDYPVERMHRDAKIQDIYEGTEQIQQLVIARAASGVRID